MSMYAAKYHHNLTPSPENETALPRCVSRQHAHSRKENFACLVVKRTSGPMTRGLIQASPAAATITLERLFLKHTACAGQECLAGEPNRHRQNSVPAVCNAGVEGVAKGV